MHDNKKLYPHAFTFMNYILQQLVSSLFMKFNMKLRGSLLLVIVSCLVVELVNVIQKRYVLSIVPLFSRITGLTAQGLLFLLYPLLGHLTDVYLTRYRSLKVSYGLIIFGICATIVWTGIDVAASIIWNFQMFHHKQSIVIWIVCIIVIVVGIGLFQANSIQFGLDQLLEAPTPKLIAFIHWYYWAQNVSALAVFYIYISTIIFSAFETNCNKVICRTLSIALLIMAVTVFTVILVKICNAKKHMYIQKAGHNPFKNIYKVLKYSWKHKVPEHRSAFTYWEEDIPHRIDLGKNKYGGPFTNEEVEDTKTFLRILPLLLCLFGYHLAGDGYSAPEQLQRTSCPSLPVLLLIVSNPLHLSTLVAVVGIPLYRLVIAKVLPRLKNVRMLTKMWIGLYLSLVQVALYIIVVVNHDTTYWQQHHSAVPSHGFYHYTPSSDCITRRIGYDIHININRTFHQYNDPVDNIYLWFIIPQLLNGLSSLLVSMTVFEFICAQAPRTTQGLLIGLWYATFSIRYFVVSILDNLIIERRSWLIYEGVKGFLILVSLVLFSCISRCYRYRQRDEIVNVQGMIEDTHERWLRQEEEYMQEQGAFYSNITGTYYYALPQ